MNYQQTFDQSIPCDFQMLSRSKGVLLPLEAEYKTMVNGLSGVYNLGVLYTNAPQSDLYTPQGTATKFYNDTWFFWGGFNQQVTQKPGDRERGMSVSASMSLADQRTNPYHIVASGEMRYRGLLDTRSDDYLGLGLTWFDMSNHLVESARQSNDANSIMDYYNPLYQPVAGKAINIDLYYRLRLVSWLDIQPDIQYWINPGGIKETKDALVLGLKTAVRF
ncbi:Porin B [Sodalis praecaptivus]|uniref:carbohydrate porin n=1 Tax=Sodalis praecaptivus TaxID=1239307 RepID=UPI0027FDE472|nr:carbohydrate porin [Sodalis praecaptivus]CAJ0995832.1 Porin B [Sodalis praecaptivus]